MRSNEGKLDIETILTIKKIMNEYKTYATHARAPIIFKVTVGIEILKFKHSVQVEVTTEHARRIISVGLKTI